MEEAPLAMYLLPTLAQPEFLLQGVTPLSGLRHHVDHLGPGLLGAGGLHDGLGVLLLVVVGGQGLQVAGGVAQVL